MLTGLAVGAPAWAQDSSNVRDVRPAITSYWGDTGLWFVPTAEVLKPGGWAFGAYRTELDFKQGSTDVAYYPGTLAVGAGGRTEIFAAVRAVTSVDRDTRPLFAPATAGEYGVVNDTRSSDRDGQGRTSATSTQVPKSTWSRSIAGSRWRWQFAGR